MIPKIIHYCWFGNNEMSDTAKKCIQTWESLNPDYRLYRWDESNSPIDHHFVRAALESKKYAFAADYVRLWAIYNFGGVYLDCDMFLIKKLDDLLHNSCFLGYENSRKSIISAGIIGAHAKHDLLYELMNSYNRLSFQPDKLSEFIITKLITKSYSEQQFPDVKIYDHDSFYPLPFENRDSILDFLKFKTQNTFAIHLWEKSWWTTRDECKSQVRYCLKKLLKLIRLT